ncbi:MAG: hypothetical protein R2991_06345 [Thermoanaerobaculia bacterium]
MTRLLLIVGMHRSGTSAAAGAVEALGMRFGEDLLPGQPHDNPKGFFEHAELVAAHDALLASAGRTWDDPTLWISERPALPGASAFLPRLESLLRRETAGDGAWCAKDPRLCRLLPAWKPILEASRAETRILLVHRDPAEVVRSLWRRDGFSVHKAALLWIDHVLGAERWSRGLRRTVLSFADLRKDPVAVLDRVGESLALPWPASPTERRGRLEEFLGGKAPGGAPGVPGSSAALELATEIWRVLESRYPDLPPADELDELAGRIPGRLQGADPLLLEHVGQVLERTVASRLWTRTTPIEQRLGETRSTLESTATDLRARLAKIEEALDTLAAGVSRLGSEEQRQADAVESASRGVVELGKALHHLATEFDRTNQDARASRASQEEALGWLAGRLDIVERRTATLLARLRSWFRRG